MIHFVLGGFGSGKSYAGMRMIRTELVEGERPICSNLAVNEKQLASYLHYKYPKAKVCLHQRYRQLEDNEIAQFFLHRVSTNALWYDIPAPDIEAEKRGARPDWSLVRDNGIMFVIEEAHEFFNSRYWQEIGRCFGAYKNQNRKFSDDIIFITPQLSEIDKQLRSIGQSYTVLTNLGMRVIHGVKMPSIFMAKEYSGPPDRTMHPINTYRYSLDKELADCYDTAKGVRGVKGLLADKNKKTRGIPWWIPVALFVLVAAAFLVLPRIIGGHILRKMVTTPARVQTALNGHGNMPAVPLIGRAQRAEQSIQGSPSVANAQPEDTNDVYCTGWFAYSRNHVEAYLSDGRVADSRRLEIQDLEFGRVKVFNEWYRVNRPVLPYIPVQANQFNVSAPSYNEPQEEHSSVSLTFIGQSYLSRNEKMQQTPMNYQSSLPSVPNSQLTTTQQPSSNY